MSCLQATPTNSTKWPTPLWLARAVSDATHFVFRVLVDLLSNTLLGKNISAGAELFERMTRRYGKPTFGLDEIQVDGVGLHPGPRGHRVDPAVLQLSLTSSGPNSPTGPIN